MFRRFVLDFRYFLLSPDNTMLSSFNYSTLNIKSRQKNPKMSMSAILLKRNIGIIGIEHIGK